MPVRKLKPVTPSQRFRIINGFDSITTDKPEKSLLVPKKRTGGRNNRGKMTVKYRGGAPPLYLTVILPLLFLPPVLFLGTNSDFSGLSVVIESKPFMILNL